MAKGTTRHLKYVWIEYGNPKDGAAFTDGLYSLGWGNLLGDLPVKQDAWGQRRVTSKHPLLPIRYRGTGLLVLPNNRLDNKKLNYPYITDPIFNSFRSTHGDTAFDSEIDKQNRFLAQWVFSPGIKKHSDSDVELTIGSDFTEYADWAVISGHGAGGTCWGGGSGADLSAALRVPPEPPTDRLKYVIIATCYNLALFNAEVWLPAMRRSNPIHGFLGYGDGYPGDEPGKVFFTAFANNLKGRKSKKDAPGTKPILDAWREAHVADKKIWAAIMHTSCLNDNMNDWLAGKLTTPSPAGEVRWFDESNFPTGTVLTDRPPRIRVLFTQGATKIDRSNNSRKDVGLFPGDSGALEITNTADSFEIGEVLTIIFYYFRPTKDGMDLSKLLKFGTSPDGTLTLKKDLNKQDRTANIDALELKLSKRTATINIPYTVEPNATTSYARDGESHGYFNLRITPPGETVGGNRDLRPYPDGVWLRPKIS